MERIKESMQRARQEREALQVRESVVIDDAPQRERRRSWKPAGSGQLAWLAGGMILGAAIVSLTLLWRSGYLGTPLDHAAGPAAPAATPEHARLMQETSESLVLLGSELQQLTESIAGLEQRVQQLRQEDTVTAVTGNQATPATQAGVAVAVADAGRPGTTGSAPAVARAEPVASAAGAAEQATPAAQTGVAVAMADADRPVTTGSTSAVATAEPVASAAGAADQVNVQPGGPWVINLVSLPDRASVDPFMRKAASLGIATATQQVTVKGRDYWRVQVTGFPSSAAAVAGSADIREKLGLKDVWVSRR
jgi:septal ring-binding cell division protein DamX